MLSTLFLGVLFSYTPFVDVTDNVGITPSTFGRDAVFFDYNGDKLKDIFFTSIEEGKSKLYENLGDGTFLDVSGVTLHNLRSGVRKAYPIDYDGDGYKDLSLIEAIPGESPVIFRNKGNGSFEYINIGDIRTEGILEDLTFVDLEGDGDIDILAVSSMFLEEVYLSVFLNENGVLREEPSILGENELYGIQSKLLSDIDQDGMPELYIIKEDSLYVYKISGDDSSFTVHSYGVYSSGRSVSLSSGDFDSDGNIELAVLDDIGILSIYKIEDNQPLNWLSFQVSSEIDGVDEMLPLDFDIDGNLDLLVLSNAGELHLLQNNLISFRDITKESGLSEIHDVFSVDVYDYNGDRRPDLLLSKEDGPRLLMNNTEGNHSIKLNFIKEKDIPNSEIAVRMFYLDKVFATSQIGDEIILGLGEFNWIDSIFVRWQNGEELTVRYILGDTALLLSPSVNKGLEVERTSPSGWISDSLIRLFPNPSRNEFILQYTLDEDSYVEVSLLNTSGQVIETLVKESFAPGAHSVIWDTQSLQPGTYIVRIKINNELFVRKFVLLK